MECGDAVCEKHERVLNFDQKCLERSGILLETSTTAGSRYKLTGTED